jgi:hypothetical protein
LVSARNSKWRSNVRAGAGQPSAWKTENSAAAAKATVARYDLAKRSKRLEIEDAHDRVASLRGDADRRGQAMVAARDCVATATRAVLYGYEQRAADSRAREAQLHDAALRGVAEDSRPRPRPKRGVTQGRHTRAHVCARGNAASPIGPAAQAPREAGRLALVAASQNRWAEADVAAERAVDSIIFSAKLFGCGRAAAAPPPGAAPPQHPARARPLLLRRPPCPRSVPAVPPLRAAARR